MGKPEKPDKCDDRVVQFDLTHARHDPAHCLAPGLFQSLPRRRNVRRRTNLDIVYETPTQRIEWKGPHALGPDDLRVLQGLVAMAGPEGLVLSPEPHTAGGEQLRLALDLKWDALKQNALVARGSYRTLAREIGYAHDGGQQFRAIRDSIERLWTVSVIVQEGHRRRGFRVLSEYASDDAEGRLYVALNPMITKAILGDAKFVKISMVEVRALEGDVTRLLHQRLCG